MLTQSQYSNYKFAARLDHIKTFNIGIKALSFADNAMCCISDDGFRATVEQDAAVQANLFVPKIAFSEFHIVGNVTFSINVQVLAQCLSLFSGVDCSTKLLYKDNGSPLVLVIAPLNVDDVITECAIKTANYEDVTEFSLKDEGDDLNVVFIRGPDFASILRELDKAAEELELILSPRAPHFKIAMLGAVQIESSVEVAKSSDMMQLFNCHAKTVARYKSHLIRLTNKIAFYATKAAIKTDISGLLEMDFMLQAVGETEIYIQFFVVPLTDFD